MDQQNLIKQGAEAKIFKTTHENRPVIIKERLVKSYRHPDLDLKLTKARINQESRCLSKCLKNGIKTPEVYKVDNLNRSIIMEYIPGPSFRDVIRDSINHGELKDLASQLGAILSKMHDLSIIHGDLTTSNILVLDEKLVMIDFGLSFNSASEEDKAVDLYVLERAFASTHPNSEDLVCSN